LPSVVRTSFQKIKGYTDGQIPISSLCPDLTPEETDEIRESWVTGSKAFHLRKR
jgi:hypothetical protein